ncbi:hypothetical protein OROMI_012955 [Orobanche minor]
MVFKIRPSQEILKIRDGTPLDAEEILTYIKKPSKQIVWHFSSKLDVTSNILQKKRKRVAQILVFKIRPCQEILKIRDGTPSEAEEILIYRKSPRNGSVWYFSSKIDVPSNVLQKKRVARILVFKIRPSQEILKIRDGTPSEKKRVAQILVFKLRPSQEILKIRDDVPSNVLQKKRVARIQIFKIRPSQEINKIHDPFGGGRNFDIQKKPRNGSVWHFSSKLDVPSNVLYKKRVAQILVFKIRPSQEIPKIRDGTPSEAEEILTYRKKHSKCVGLVFFEQFRCSYKLDVPSNVLQKKRVARILVFKIRPSQEINKIRDGTLLEAEEILTYRKKPRNGSVWHFSSKLDVPSNVLQKKRVAQILVFKIRPSQEILKIRDGTPSKKKRLARILVFKIRPSQEILKNRDGTPLDAEEILRFIKKPSKQIVWHFSSKLDVPSNILQKKRVARILFFKIWPSQEILKIRYDVPSNVLQKKRVAQILVFKIRPSQEILKIRDGTPSEKKRVARILVFKIRPSQEINKIRDGTLLEKKRVAQILVFKIRPSQEILKIRDDVPSNVLQKKRVARILVFKIRPSQEINKIRNGTPLEAEEILTYRKKPRNGSVWHFSSKLDVPSNVLQKKRVAQILVFKIRPSQEILKIRDGTPSEAEEILTYRKKPSKWVDWYFSSNLDVPSNVLQKKRVAWILFFKIWPSQDILQIRDGTHLEKKRVAQILVFKIRPSQEILKIRDVLDVPSNVLQKKRVARILVFKIRPSQEINKIRDGTLLEAEEILTYRKKPRNGSVWHFSSKLDVPSNVLQKKRVAQILVFKIRPSQEILKIRDDVPSNVLQKKRVARILVFKIRPSQEINKIRNGTPLEAEEILTYRKKPRNGSVWHFSSKLDVPSNVLQKKRVAQILVFKIRPSQEILKIRDGTPSEAEEILTYRKKPSKWVDWYFSSNLDVPSNVLQKKRVAWILFFKIWPSQDILQIRDGTHLEKRVARIMVFKIRLSQEILKIRDGTPSEAEEILTYRKKPQNGSVWHFSSKLDVPSNVLHKKRVAQILVFKIRPSQEILKIRDGTPSEAEEVLTYRKSPQNGSVWYFYSNLDVPSNVLQNKRVAWILFFKIWPSQDILQIRDGTHLELDVPSKVLQKKRVARIMVFKTRPSQEINKIRDGTPLEAEEILTYRKKAQNGLVWHFSSKLDVPSNILQKKRVAQILVFKIRPSQEIPIIRDGTPSEAEEILTYIKRP